MFDGIDLNAFESLSSSLIENDAVRKFPSQEDPRVELDTQRSTVGVLDFLENYQGMPYANKVSVVCRYFAYLNADRKAKNAILERVDDANWGVYCSLL